MNKNLKRGGFAAIFTVIVIAAVIVVNLIANAVPAKYRRLDLSTSQIFSISDTTKELLNNLTKDVTIYIVGDPDRIDQRITHFASLYADLSDRINVEIKDPVLHPDVLSTLDTEANTVLVSCPDTGKTRSIPFMDIIQLDLMAYYQYQQYRESAFDGEGQITSAISYVSNDTDTSVYQLSGHKESALPSLVTDALRKSNMELKDLNLLTDGSIPGDCELLLINNPQTDIAADEKEMISGYLKQGGRVLILTGYTDSGCPNLAALCADYGLELKNGYVADTAPGQFYNNNPFLFFPEYDFSGGMLAGITSKDPALLSNPSGMTISPELRDGLTVTPFLTTTDSGVFVDPVTQEQTPGTYVLGATATEPVNSPEAPQAATASQAQAQSQENSSSQEDSAAPADGDALEDSAAPADGDAPADGNTPAGDDASENSGSLGDGDSQENNISLENNDSLENSSPQENNNSPEATLTVITAPSLIDGALLQQFPSITNLTIFMNAASHNISHAVNLSIPAKSLEVTYNMITAGGLWSALFIIVIPVIFLIAGFVIWMKRRKL